MKTSLKSLKKEWSQSAQMAQIVWSGNMLIIGGLVIILSIHVQYTLGQNQTCPQLCVCFPSVVNCMYLNYTFLPKAQADTEIL